jgi:hypothetical protein
VGVQICVRVIVDKHRAFRNDIIVIAVVLAAALAIYAGLRFFTAADTGTATVVVTIDGAECGRYPLSENMTKKIELADGSYNVLVIEDGEAVVTEASCPDKICVDHRAISRKNESIICLPNKVVVTIENGEASDLDAFASAKFIKR